MNLSNKKKKRKKMNDITTVIWHNISKFMIYESTHSRKKNISDIEAERFARMNSFNDNECFNIIYSIHNMS